MAFKAAAMAIWGLISFLLVEVFIWLPLYLTGVIAVWAADHWGAKTRLIKSRIDPDRYVLSYSNHFLNWWIGNYEDGIDPESLWWPELKSKLDWFLRNPNTNLRFAPIISTLPDPEKLEWVGTLTEVPGLDTPGWFLVWQGPYVGFLWQGKKCGVWLGWALNPRDKQPMCPRDYRWHGVGIKAQVWSVR
jgi:hypothetical protein